MPLPGATRTLTLIFLLAPSAFALRSEVPVSEPSRGDHAAHFSVDGVTVASEIAPATLRLALTSWGREHALAPVEAGTEQADGDRYSIRRAGVTEWYVDAGRGVEQGFTIETRPPGTAPLRLEIAVRGGFATRIHNDAHHAEFTDPSGPARFSYSGLRAWDAAGQELDARFTPADAGIAIHIDDADATYPLTIDPWVWSQQAKLLASDGDASDYFGWAVDLEGDTAVVGAPWATFSGSQAEAYVFGRTGTTWSEEAILTTPGALLGDDFGESVALSGDTALIGAGGHDGIAIDSGAAWVFVNNGTSWNLQQKLTPSDPAAYDNFGNAVALEGDWAVVGAERRNRDTGAVYVFERSGTSWSERAKLLASDASPAHFFGSAVDISGDTVIAGAYQAYFGHGAAYIFTRTGTTWSQEAKLSAFTKTIGDRFGNAVCLHGDTALIGAPHDSDLGQFRGTAYLFQRTGTSWARETELIPAGVAVDDYYGSSVSFDGDVAVVGSPYSDATAFVGGAAYLFSRRGTVWEERTVLGGSDTTIADSFGGGVAVDGDTILVGAHRDDDLGSLSGGAYVFRWDGAVATATFRNGGTNPASYHTNTAPILGTDYIAVIDLGGTTGHSAAVLAAFASPLTFTLGWGQTGLVNPLGPELFGLPSAPGPLAAITVPIPSDPVYAGFEIYTQAAHFGGIVPYALSNAQDLFLGY